MDSSLCLYKGKLKEALTLVPTMSPEKKAEAVAYWNDLAEQLQDIVHKSEPSYDQTCLAQSSPVTSDSDLNSMYSAPNDCGSSLHISAAHANSSVILGLPDNNTTDDLALINPSIKQTPVDQYHRENLLDKITYENLYIDGPSLAGIPSCKNHLSNIVGDKMSTGLMGSIPANPSQSCSIQHQSLTSALILSQISPTGCPSTQDVSNVQPTDNLFEVIKHSSLLPQVPNHHEGAGEPIVNLCGLMANDVYCSNIVQPNPLVSRSQIMSMLSNDKTNILPRSGEKIVQTNDDTSAEYRNSLLEVPIAPSKLDLTVNSNLGEERFVNGTKQFDDTTDFNQFESHEQTVTLIQNAFVPSRDDLFTQSERPLQQIQLFNPNPPEYSNQPYTLVNRAKYLFCMSCNQQLHDPEDLERHERLHSLDDKNVPVTNIDEPESDDLQVSEVKEEEVSNIEDDKNSSSNSQHTCEVCGKSGFSTKGNLKRHLRAHSGEKPFKCEFCDSCFTEKKSLKIHVRRHTGEKPYKCEICGKLFSQTGVLQSHMALHLNERKFECQKCGKAFRQRSQLKLHLMRHDGVKRLECSTCMAKFLTKGDMERHCRIHTGERPYACEICEKTFTRQQSLNEHINRHTGRKPYDCKYCDKTFSEMSACYKHAKTHKRQGQLSHVD